MVDFDPYNGYPISRSVADMHDFDYMGAAHAFPQAVKHPSRHVMVRRPMSSLNAYYYQLIESKQVGQFLIIKVKYPSAPHFEGVKVLVYEGIDVDTLLKQKCIDPHFSESTKIHHPVARFLPTAQGWANAVKFCEMLEAEQCPSYSF